MPRIAIVEPDKCNPVGCGDYLCARVCPINKEREAEECIFRASNGKAGIDENLCIGCNICVKKCPYNAISIINLPGELARQPIHQFGKNGFHLYNLPIPIFGKVVGILGKNGIGKSTAIKILAGILKPNLSKDQDAEFDALIDYFKGTEAQFYFEKLKKGEISIAYKPQQVDLIPKNTKGSVIELLKKVDEKGELEKVAKILEIDKVLNRNIKDISGGELQRVAIAATVLKKANFYIFDEPTSYLDIKQRIKVSQFIRELADENTAVMVVEHDLIILDYMTDMLHIMYGKEACYGIVSNLKVTKNGINTYLEGYIREENMRFRANSIKFENRAPLKTVDMPSLISWSDIHKKLGSFEITAEKGEVQKSQVIGILGENGIGKTSFVKILAGVIKQDKGTINKTVTVSYKPQYIDTESEELVANAIADAVSKYKVELIHPLSLDHLLAKRVCDLSGGELQRVAVANCLSQTADLYLLDEPSAYLDVEQRLLISRLIRDIMEKRNTTALIVDHDLLFLDYLSTKLIVFDGVPAESGLVNGPFTMEDGMNKFLKELAITMRRDPESFRPRINKPDSVLDRKQKQENKLYYS